MAVTRTIFVAAALSSLWVSSANACEDRLSVGLQFEGTWSEAEREGIRGVLGSSLASRDICLASDSAGNATILVRRQPESIARLTVEVRDALTAKRVERDFDFSSFGTDARALAIAIAADELLIASWAELAIDRPPPEAVDAAAPSEDDVQQARSVVVASGEQQRVPTWLTLGAELFYAPRGMTLSGASLSIEREFGAFEGLVGIRVAGGQRGVEEGRVRGILIAPRIGLAVAFLRGSRARIGLATHVDVGAFRLEGRSDTRGTRGGTRAVALLDAGLLASWRGARAGFRLFVGAGGPLVGATGDGEQRSVGLRTIGLSTHLGLRVRLR
ncbi:MAG: hypothetical protein AAF411_08125 [Myxococcota bacterium]